MNGAGAKTSAPAMMPVRRRQRRTRYTRWRRATQAAFAVTFVLLPLAGWHAITGSLVAPTLGPVDVAEPASALSAAAAARTISASLLVVTAPLLVLAAILGPVYCSWACPYGLASELIDGARHRRWTGKRPWSPRRLRIAVLVGLLAASLLLGMPVAAIVAPPRLVTALPLEARSAAAVPVVSTALLALVFLVELLGPRRLVCRLLCPAGTVAALLRTRGTLAPRLDEKRCRCSEVAPCVEGCPWGLDPRSSRARDGCTTCLSCLDRCPSRALFLSRSTRRTPTLDMEER